MSKALLKILFLFLALISIFWTIELVPDRTNRRMMALSLQEPFQKELVINQKFITDFKSSYKIGFSLENPEPYNTIDSLQPLQLEYEILHKGKSIDILDNNSFLSKRYGEYELRLKFINANSYPNILRIGIQTDVPGPSYDILIEEEFEWIFWIINGIVMLIALICGYFGFKKNTND